MTFSRDDRCEFAKAVAAVFADLGERGFHRSHVVLSNTTALGDFLEICVNNDRTGRGIRVNLLRSPDATREALTVFIENRGSAAFLIDDFLKAEQAAPETVRRCDLSFYHGTLHQKMLACLGYVRSVIDEQLGDVLEGREWPDVPMDWGDYK